MKDGWKELLHYVNLIRFCLNALNQLVYKRKKNCIPQRNFVFNKPVGPIKCEKCFVYYMIFRFCNSLQLELQLPKQPLPRQKLSFQTFSDIPLLYFLDQEYYWPYIMAHPAESNPMPTMDGREKKRTKTIQKDQS